MDVLIESSPMAIKCQFRSCLALAKLHVNSEHSAISCERALYHALEDHGSSCAAQPVGNEGKLHKGEVAGWFSTL